LVSFPDIGHRGTQRLRLTWALFVAPVVVAIAVVAIAEPPPADGTTTWFTVIVVSAAIVDFAGAFWIRRVGAEAILALDSNDAIRDGYYRRMVLACAFVVTPALLAFAFAFTVGTTVVFYLVAAAALVLLAYAGPRRGDIELLDDRMVDAGRSFRVSAALDS
jgi:F0F1-type ATP synthase membrane subunit c/vacuolar-type H+-ATPase subunit K